MCFTQKLINARAFLQKYTCFHIGLKNTHKLSHYVQKYNFSSKKNVQKYKWMRKGLRVKNAHCVFFTQKKIFSARCPFV